MQPHIKAVLLCCAWLLGVLLSPAAMAHAVLLDTSPADHSVLAASPAELVLHFNEPIRPVTIGLIGQDGQWALPASRIETSDQEIRIRLTDPLPAGSWLLSYRVMSADSHPVVGTIQFSVGHTAESGELAATASTELGWQMLAALMRLLLFAATTMVVGGVLFDRLVHVIDSVSRQRLAWTASAGAVLALISIGLRGGLLADADFAELAGLALWHTGFHSSFGTSMICAAIGFVLATMGLRTDKASGMRVAGLAALLVLASFALSGHVTTANPRWLMIPMLLLHAGTMAFWIGALPQLLHFMQGQPSLTYTIVRRFSQLAVLGVAILVGSGVVIAVIQVGDWSALAATNYGRLLLLKLTVVAALIGLAAWNKLHITPEILRDPRRGLTRLRGSIRLELVLAASVLAVTAVLGLSSPPRTLHKEALANTATGYSTTLPHAQFSTALLISPAMAGNNRLEITMTAQDGSPFTPLEIEIELSNPDRNIGPIVRRLEASGAGHYQLDGPEFALGGDWTVRIGVLVTDFDKVWLEASVPIE